MNASLRCSSACAFETYVPCPRRETDADLLTLFRVRSAANAIIALCFVSTFGLSSG